MSRNPRPRRTLALLPTLAIVAGLAGAPSPTEAQFMPSILELVPVDGRTLQVGDSIFGLLDVGDLRLPDGRPIQAWRISGAPGSWIWIDVMSDEIDAYLYIIDPERRELLFDDDSGGGCNSRIPIEIPAGGYVTAYVSSVGLALDGGFTLHAGTEERERAPHACSYEGVFDGGEAFQFELPEMVEIVGTVDSIPASIDAMLAPGAGPEGPMGGSILTWEVDFEEGQIIVIDLIADHFDPVLILEGPGIDGYLYDDDGGSGLDSRIFFPVLIGGTYRIHVTGWGEDAEGTYTLQIVDQREGS